MLAKLFGLSYKFNFQSLDLIDRVVHKNESKWPPAVIAGAYQTGVLAVRSLKRHGINAICFDSNPLNQGFKSVYGQAKLCPNPDTDSEKWLNFMIELSSEIGNKPALIPSSDKFISAIEKYSDILSDYYILSPGIHLQGLLTEKQTQYELAERHGMPMPRTRYVHTIEDIMIFAQEASFPCLIKPTHFREWHKSPRTHP